MAVKSPDKMVRLFTMIAALLALLAPHLASADAADIDAAARGVVRVVIVGDEDGELYPISHGSGFAVSPQRVVTNAHVVRDALRDDRLRIGIVPSEGGEAVYARVVAVNGRNDLALVEIDGALRLPPLALAGGTVGDSGESYSVGYPMNVDRAQGLEIGDIFRAQPPVKSRGFLAGTRPSRQFHTVLHTAPIARGNSGGPLLDGCGRVLGVNSFGADTGSSDAEFFFAVSNRELIPFLRENKVEPRINAAECRSLADLDADERERQQREQLAARADLEQASEAARLKRERARFEAEMSVRDERDDRMFAAIVLLLLAAGAIWWGFEKRAGAGAEAGADGEQPAWPVPNRIAVAIGLGAILVALLLHITRPGIDEIDRRVANATGEGGEDAGLAAGDAAQADKRKFSCTLIPQRSRVTSSKTDDLAFEWSAGGCVNERTQYGFSGGTWSRVLVPNEEQAVSVNSFDPDRRIFRTERYLLSRGAMSEARSARGKYTAPACTVEDAAGQLGDLQSAVLSALPASPNERLVYECEAVEG